MSGTRAVGVRIEANAKQAEAEIERFAGSAEGGLARAGSAAAALGAAFDQLGAGAEKAGEGLGKAGAGTETFGKQNEESRRSVSALTRDLGRLAAGFDPVEAAYQRWMRTQKLVDDARAKGIQITDTHALALDRDRAAYERLAVQMVATGQAQSRLDGGFASAGRGAASFGSATENASKSSGKLAGDVQNLSYQVGDFAVQVASGQSALTALAQQLPQALGGFGMVGALAGAVVAIGAVGLKYWEATAAAQALDAALEAQEDSYERATRAADQFRNGLASEIEAVQNLAVYYGNLSEARREAEQINLERQRNSLDQQRRDLVRELTAPLAGRVAAGQGDLVFDLSGMGGALSSIGGNQAAAYAEDMRQATEVTRQFAEANVVTTQAVTEYMAALRQAAAAGGGNNIEIMRAHDVLVAALPRVTAYSDAVGTAKIQQDAMAGSADALAAAAARASARIADLKGIAAAQASAPEEALRNAEALVSTLEKGGIKAAESLQRTQQAAGTLDDRVRGYFEAQATAMRNLAKAEADQLVQQDKREEAAQRLAGVEDQIAKDRVEREGQVRQQFQQTDATLERYRQRVEQAREAEAAAARAASAARRDALAAERREVDDLARTYDTLRRDGRSGLLLTGESDRIAVRTILDAIRGTPLDPEVRERQRREAERDAERASREQQRRAERTTDSIVDYAGDRFADLFLDGENRGKRMWENIQRTAIATAARIATEFALRPIVAPIVTYFTGAGVAAAGAAGATRAGAGSAGGVTTIPTGGLFGGGTLASGFDAWAADAVPGLFSVSNTAATNSALASMGPGVYGPATPASVTAAQGGFFGTASGTAMGALGVAGGAYGIYSGIQTGGARGWAQGAAGAAGVVGGLGTLAAAGGTVGAGLTAAAPWLAAAGPYGLAAAAVLTIASMLLPGAKPSDKTGTYQSDLLAGTEQIGGFTGSKFDQGNRDAAAGIGDQINGIAEQLRTILGVDRTPFEYTVAVGNRDGISAYYNGGRMRYERDEQGIEHLVNDITRALIDSMMGLASAEIQSVISNSGSDNATTLANLEWYNTTYQAAIKAPDTEAMGQLAAAQKALATAYDDLREKATSLGLTTDALNKRQAELDAQLIADRDKALRDANLGLDVRMLRATGRGAEADLIAFDFAAEQQTEAWKEQLRQWGISGQQLTDEIAKLAQTIGAEREDLVNQSRQATIQSARGLLEEMTYGRYSALSEREQYAASQMSYGSARDAYLRNPTADGWQEYERVARQALELSAEYTGATSLSFASLQQDIRDLIRERVPEADSAGIGDLLGAQREGVDLQFQQLDVLTALRDDYAQQTAQITRLIDQVTRQGAQIETLTRQAALA